jgi:nucleoside-diphosphate-sugar epimerase
MNDALIGWSGFVGGTLLAQRGFAERFRSTDIDRIAGREFDTIFCAGAPAQKWIANADPDGDRQRLGRLMEALGNVRCRHFVLVSTVDVFRYPIGVDESSPVGEEGLNAYGLHRRKLEKFVQDRFPRHLIARLPGLVGPGLRKNVVFDLHNGHRLEAIDSRGVFQFYPMVNLALDLGLALSAGLELVHLTAAPVPVSAVAELGFGRPLERHLAGMPARYDFQTRHADLFGAPGNYQYSERETLLAIRAYAQSEPRVTAEPTP